LTNLHVGYNDKKIADILHEDIHITMSHFYEMNRRNIV